MEKGRSRRNVLLVVCDGEFCRKVIAYAFDFCERIDAGLEIFFALSGDSPAPELAKALAEPQVANTNWRIVSKMSDLKREVLEYVAANKNIVYVVADSLDGLDGGKTDSSEIWRDLACPLILARVCGKAA